jgi:hypothetical protein
MGNGGARCPKEAATALEANAAMAERLCKPQDDAATASVECSECTETDLPDSAPWEETLAGEEVDSDLLAFLARARNSWDFNALELADLTGNMPLSVLATYLFDELELVEHCKFDRTKLVRFFEQIERGYDDTNRYHNRAHAASVLHSFHVQLEHGGLAERAARAFWGQDWEARRHLLIAACLIAAAVHDFEHRGLNNDFLVSTCDTWAKIYNNLHVNEAHHVVASFATCQDDANNFAVWMPREDFDWLRGLCVDLVLATDMADNNAVLGAFTTALEASEGASFNEALDGFAPSGPQEAVLLLQMAMKCADLGHLSLSWDVHNEWLRRLEEEMFAQGDLELSRGMPPSFLMDRAKPGASSSQVGFMGFVALPLFSALARAAPTTRPLLQRVTRNYDRWVAIETPRAGGDESVGTQEPGTPCSARGSPTTSKETPA